jgi:dolichol-phosphate mannosyltransferase
MASSVDSLEVGSANAAGESAVLPRLSIVVPCHNEAESLGKLVAQLQPLRSALAGPYEMELLLVDDGSTDETWRKLQELFSGDAAARLIKHDVNRGIAAAIGTGLAHASGELVASLDADCTYEPLQLVALLARMTPEVDLVVASPYHPQGKVVGVPGWRLALSRLASRMYRAVMRNKLHTYTSCVRVYRRGAVVDLPVQRGGFVGIVELVWQLDRRGGRIVECPAVLTVRTTGQSKMRVARVALSHLSLLAEAAWDRLIGRREQSATKSVDAISNQTSRFATRTV